VGGKRVQCIIDAGKPCDKTVTFTRRSGPATWFGVCSTPLRDIDGHSGSSAAASMSVAVVAGCRVYTGICKIENMLPEIVILRKQVYPGADLISEELRKSP
jgi:hypothetical protein